MTSSIVLTHEMYFLAWKQDIWAIKRKRQFNSSTWARAREKQVAQLWHRDRATYSNRRF